jgi:transposase
VVGVMIGIDPHKGSHTAFALDASETKLGQVRVRATVGQVEGLLEWAQRWPERSWAIEGAGGLGYLLAQQLLAAGERVLNVQPKLAARVRLLNTGQVNKNDPNDARSVAIAALRSPDVRTVTAEGDTAVIKLWARRHRDLSRARNRIACRLHAVLCELVPGGFAKEITAGQATHALAVITPLGASAVARLELAHELLDEQRRATKKRITRIVAATKTSVTDIYGVGPIIAATVLGYVGDIHRFPTRDHFAAYNGTAPIEASSGNNTVHRLSRRGNRQLNHAIHMAALSQIRYPDTIGRAYYDRKIAEGMKHKSALRALKRKISDAIYTRMITDAWAEARHAAKDPGGQSGNDSASSAAGSHPETPALRTSHSRVDAQPKTVPSPASPTPSPPHPKPSRRSP